MRMKNGTQTAIMVTTKRQSLGAIVNICMPKTDYHAESELPNHWCLTHCTVEVAFGITYRDEAQWEEQHRDSGEDLDVFALLDRHAVLFH